MKNEECGLRSSACGFLSEITLTSILHSSFFILHLINFSLIKPEMNVHPIRPSFRPLPALVAVVAVALPLLCSCSSQRVATLETVRHDTVQTALWHYDSVYIDRFVKQDQRHDTILLTDRKTEYRYKVIHDTVRTVRTDSVPYPVRNKSSPKGDRRGADHVPPWIYLIFGILLAVISFLIIRK